MNIKKKNYNLTKKLIFIIFIITISFISYINNNTTTNSSNNISNSNIITVDLENIPDYTGNPYIEINNNIPFFNTSEYTTSAFEQYSKLDNLGRCGVAYANICKEIMPDDSEERDSLSSITPSGWKQARYDSIVEGNYLYNRCHLIAYNLAGENANKNNLITGTRYMNVQGMLPFENNISDYIDKNNYNHVLYRVTPIFEGNNLIADGVQMEAYSVEDNGKGICFNVYVYNVQPGIIIDYKTGTSHLAM